MVKVSVRSDRKVGAGWDGSSGHARAWGQARGRKSCQGQVSPLCPGNGESGDDLATADPFQSCRTRVPPVYPMVAALPSTPTRGEVPLFALRRFF